MTKADDYGCRSKRKTVPIRTDNKEDKKRMKKIKEKYETTKKRNAFLKWRRSQGLE